MALNFNLNLASQGHMASNNNSTESAGSLASTNAESAGSLAFVSQSSSGGLLSNNSQVDEFVSSNPFAPQIDYSQYESAGSLACESAGSLACGESAGSLACAGESAGSLASAGGCESAGSVASGGGDSFSSFC